MQSPDEFEFLEENKGKPIGIAKISTKKLKTLDKENIHRRALELMNQMYLTSEIVAILTSEFQLTEKTIYKYIAEAKEIYSNYATEINQELHSKLVTLLWHNIRTSTTKAEVYKGAELLMKLTGLTIDKFSIQSQNETAIHTTYEIVKKTDEDEKGSKR